MKGSQSKKSNIEYTGKLAKYQLYAENTYMEYAQDAYSSYQNYLYKRALYGLSAFTQQELAQMCSEKKKRIANVYVKGQRAINRLKQEVTIKYSNLVFKTLFPNSPITAYLLKDNATDQSFKNTLTFKDLNISKEDIITIFIAEGILPKNFYSITTDPNALPRLKGK